jgi:Na+/H+ antiporter NhaD/arsenite permease-like protein
MVSLWVLLVVFVLIAVRQIGNVRLQIWQIMLGGAFFVVVTGQISFLNAWKALDWDVLLFLFGMFAVGQALEKSGYLSHLTYQLFKKAKTLDSLVLFILFGMGLASAFLMNDTLAIIGTPVVLLLAKRHRMHPQILLLALAFAITIGSVTSPIGNPQNFLIALHGNIPNPFVTFLKFLFIPTLLNLFLTYGVLKFFYREHFHKVELTHSQEPIHDAALAFLSKVSLAVLVILVLLKIILAGLGVFEFRLTYIALLSALPVLVGSRKRNEILKNLDWHTLIFFAAMFVLMASVWETGFFQKMLGQMHLNLISLPSIFSVGILLSQLISNVPLVALYLPMLTHAGASVESGIALAAASTLAGNLLILGAASNVIIIQNAEKRGGETIGFLEFAKAGVPLTLINVVVYGLFFYLL